MGMQLTEVGGKSRESQPSSLPSASYSNLNFCFLCFHTRLNSFILVFSSIGSEK